ncbi:DNA translocase FtsK [Salsuginibacillus halophilus]|uniref:DNA translocase FtsK n=1 Tax=Salsuginibacillus halophilus TaxID=517424 RepID=A0A2P8HYG0_9BACI|nr:DNA translocase FtsK [Salsuginibacillus halophilus]PSL51247.1 DNA translocase FtsK [Salsuginibacillus halophilus]
MAKKKQQKKKQGAKNWKRELRYEIGGLAVLALGIIALFGYGFAGSVIVQFFRFFLGEWHVLLVGALISGAIYAMIKRQLPPLWNRRFAGGYLFIAAILLFSHLRLFENLGASGEFSDHSVLVNTWHLFWIEAGGSSADIGGGMIGALLFAVSHFLFAANGTRIISVLMLVIAFLLLTNVSISEMGKKGAGRLKMLAGSLKARRKQEKAEKEKAIKEKKAKKPEQETPAAPAAAPDESPSSAGTAAPEPERPVIYNFTEQAHELKAQPKEQSRNEPETDESKPSGSLISETTENVAYELPGFQLLNPSKGDGQAYEKSHISSNAKTLEATLQSFGVQAKVLEVHVGPAVTKYEVQPDTGVKVSKVVNLSDDIALALAAKDIRIEAPIPGKAAIGIEVPNQEVSMVTLREVLEAESDPHLLTVALGRDISGEPITAGLHKMPHLLVAGATGSGKSVCINGIITSLLLKAKPHEVKLMMIDPKMVELNVYNGIPHLLSPVVTEPKKAAQALKKVVSEMERRYDLFSHSGTRNIEGYNEYIKKHNENNEEKQPELPFIVVIVDELADLMMVASSEVEDAITRLAQMARAAGIHMIIATQRPSVDVITGVIKANIPSRIAFGVSSQTDSRTILDSGGAEKLLGKGDMLFLPVGANKTTRVQGAFLDDAEVESVVNAVIAQQKASYEEEMIPEDTDDQTHDEVPDELYHDAVQVIVDQQAASVSMLQRKFRIGYTRAARLVDEMEARGVVGPYEGRKPREVLVAKGYDETGKDERRPDIQ